MHHERPPHARRTTGLHERQAPAREGPLPGRWRGIPRSPGLRTAALADAEAELKRAFRSGELEFDDFEEQRAQLLREREGLTIARAKAEIASEMQAQTAETQWRTTVERFPDTSAAALDYRKDSEAEWEALVSPPFTPTVCVMPARARSQSPVTGSDGA